MIKKKLKKALRLPMQLSTRYKASKILHSLKLKATGNALYESLTNNMSLEQQELITLIEQRRTFLLSSDKRIAVIDYGAGKPSSDRTKEEMEKGVRSTALVADVCKASKPAFWATFLFKLLRKLEPCLVWNLAHVSAFLHRTKLLHSASMERGIY